jgi:hypothetical membrane protein
MSANPRPDRLARSLATVVAAGVPLLGVLAEWAAGVTPGYSRVGQTISELSAFGAPYPVIIHATFMLNGLLVLALGIAVARVLRAGPAGRLTALFLLLYGVAYLISGIFPDDSERRLVGGITENLVHDLTAQAGVASVMAALATGSWAMAHGRAWGGVASLGLAALAVDAALVVPLLADWWEGYHGLFERVMFLVTLAWVELLALRVRRAGAVARYHGVQTAGEVRG